TLKNAWTTSRQVNFFWVANFNLKFGILGNTFIYNRCIANWNCVTKSKKINFEIVLVSSQSFIASGLELLSFKQ
ncbi:hypothetical protein RK700_01700, partial [Streptococcus pneumoniae]|nr:hypothetical protein [Streptococcus pneumoniae]MDT5454090.1 hypothetical protein [Streptococcus pneumoniae]